MIQMGTIGISKSQWCPSGIGSILFTVNNRDYKEFSPQAIFHLFNRGVGKMEIFLDNEDFLFFLRRMKEALYPSTIITKGRKYIPKMLPEGSFDLLLYCLMPNHFHLAIQQLTDVSISNLILKVCTSYSKYFNKKYNRVGSVWQDQFKAVLVETNEQLLWLAAYIHTNPQKAHLVNDLVKYPYSSHLDYLGLRQGMLCRKDLILGQFNSSKDYANSITGFDESFMPNYLKLDEEGIAG